MAGKRRTNDFCYFWGVNYLLIILGAVSLGLGVAGMFLPVLPTTPFLLLTAWCWMKGSPRLHVWLMAHLHQLWLRVLLAAIAAGVTAHILSFKTKE